MPFVNAISRDRRKPLALRYTTTLLLLASVCLNVLLAQRLRRLESPLPELAIGSQLPPAAVTSLDGRRNELSFGGLPTILYYFSPTCGWCEKNWTNALALAAATSGRYRFVGVSTASDVSDYVTRHHVTFEVYSGLSLEAARAFHLGATPETIVVGSDGHVIHVWSGAYTGSRQKEIEHYFGLVLPGLTLSGQP